MWITPVKDVEFLLLLMFYVNCVIKFHVFLLFYSQEQLPAVERYVLKIYTVF